MILLFMITAPGFAIDVVVNGVPIALDVPAQVVEGRTLVPMRPIFEALGATVNYDVATQVVVAQKDGKMITFVIGQPTPGMDVPAQIIDGRTMVPARYAGEQLGASVNYTDGVVYISTSDNSVAVFPGDGQSVNIASTPDITSTTLPPAAPVITTTVPPTTVPVITSTTPPTTMPVVTTTPPTTQPQTYSQTVYITRTGEKYHRDGCRYLRQSKISISLDDARRSYGPCSVCSPPQ
jgi:hypothetical protein